MKFYRYEVVQYASMGIDGEYERSRFPNPVLQLREYDLLKETPKGYWIGYGIFDKFSWKKWIPKESRKRFAYPTKEEAIMNYIIRTKKRTGILQYQIDSCKISLNLAEEVKKELDSIKLISK